MTIVTVNGIRGYYIFRTWRKTKNGQILYAKDYGYRAWRIFIPL